MLWSIEYYYDAYGRIINKVDTSGINLSEINPFRYRSYYQDNETGWYYLNSRYYDVETLRFVTMDDICYLGANGSDLVITFIAIVKITQLIISIPMVIMLVH